MEFKSVSEYNQYLVASAIRVPALKYLQECIRIEGGLDAGFVSKLHELVSRTDCCVPHDLLVEFGVLAKNNASAHTRELLTQHGFTEGVEFMLSEFREHRGPRVGVVKRYLLKPRAFKIILMRSRQRLEEALVHYNEYQLALEREYIVNFRKRHEDIVQEKDIRIDGLEQSAKAKDDKIDRLEDLVRSLGSRLDVDRKEIKADIKEVKEQNIVLQTQNIVLQTQNIGLANTLGEVRTQNIGLAVALGEVKAQVTEVAEEVRGVADRLDEAALVAAPAPQNRLAAENLMIIRLNSGGAYDHQVIRRQTSSLNSWVARTRKKHPRMRVLLDVPGVPNARSLWLRIRERLAGRLEIQPGSPSHFRPANGLTDADLVARAREVIEAPVREFGAAAAAAKTRVQSIVETVTHQVFATLTPEDYELLGI